MVVVGLCKHTNLPWLIRVRLLLSLFCCFLLNTVQEELVTIFKNSRKPRIAVPILQTNHATPKAVCVQEMNAIAPPRTPKKKSMLAKAAAKWISWGSVIHVAYLATAATTA